jgi:hypothetical protein
MIRKHPLLAASLLLLVCVVSRASATDSVVLSQAYLGNIFLSTETVQIPLQTTGDQVTWSVKDFFGVQTNGAAPIAVAGGQATIAPALGRLGYFELHVTALRNGAAVATADTTFAVVAPSNVSAMHDSPFGLVTHFAQGWDTSVMPLLARCGVAQIRDEQYWEVVEPTLTTPPTYTFASYQPYLAAAASNGLNVLTTLDFNNPNYDGGNTPYTDAGRTGYANYGKALLGHYGTQIDSVGIWNEYNGSYTSGPATSDLATNYAAMLKAAYTAIKTQQPNARVIGCAAVPIPLPWYEDLFAKGSLDYLDVVDAHAYRSIPEGVETDIAALQTLEASYNHGNGPKPIWSTECGIQDTTTEGRQDLSRYLVRLMTLMRTAGVERMYWYLGFDYGGYYAGVMRGPTDPLGPYVPTSTFPAYSTLIQQLYGATYISREATDDRTRFYLFRRNSTDVHVLWSTSGTAQLVLTASGPLTRTNIVGESTVLQPTNGVIVVTADNTPSYFTGSISAVRELGRDVIVADTFRDFSGTQGTTNGSLSYGNTFIPDGGTYDPSSLTPMTYTRAAFFYEWDSFYAYAKIDSTGGHPSARYGYPVVYPVWTVRRWMSNTNATAAHLTGTIIRSSPFGDGTGARIYVDGNLVYSNIVGGQGAGVTVNFDVTTPIQVGSKVDFVLTPGSGIDIDFDYADFRALISVPGPTAAVSHVEYAGVGQFLDSSGATLNAGGLSIGYFAIAEPTASQWSDLASQSAATGYATLTGAAFGFVDLRSITNSTQGSGFDWSFAPPNPSPNFVAGTEQNIPVVTLPPGTQLYILAFNNGVWDPSPANSFLGSTQWAALAATNWVAPASGSTASLTLDAVDTPSEVKVGTDAGNNVKLHSDVPAFPTWAPFVLTALIFGSVSRFLRTSPNTHGRP